MVRVGGGWVALDEFLVKNDPCRGKSINLETLFFDILGLVEYSVKHLLKDAKKRHFNQKHLKPNNLIK